MNARVTRILLPAILALVVAGVIGAPAGWQWRHAAAKSDKHLEQVTTVASPSETALVAKLATAGTSPQSPPLILTYHDIGYNSSRYTVTPESFAAQMQLLADAGWTTITAAQLSDWLQGTPLPPHSVMISFDDGAAGVWQYADPVLASHGQHAIAYIITGSVDTHAPYYLTWQQISYLQSSGRWDFGSHTDDGHGHVPIDAAGTEGPFLSSYAFLPDQRRSETTDEFRARVDRDLTESKRRFVEHGLPDPAFFAFPFSSAEENPPTPNVNESGVLNSVVTGHFQAAMLDSPDVVATTSSTDLDKRYLDRMDITVDVSLDQWVGRLLAASPMDPVAAHPFDRLADWVGVDDVALTPVGDHEVEIGPSAQTYVSSRFARDKTTMWQNYTVGADLGGFVHSGDGTSTGLIALAGDPNNQVEVSVSDGAYQISVAGREGIAASGSLASARSYHTEIAVRPDGITVRIDGNQVATFAIRGTGAHPAGGGIAISGVRLYDTSPVPRVAALEVW